MQGKSHLAIGVTTAAWFAYALPAPIEVRVTAGLVVALGSLAPDIDHGNAWITHLVPGGFVLSWIFRLFGDHRGWTHDVRLGPPAFGAAFAAGAWFLHGPFGQAWWAYGLAMFVGCLSHIYADARTVSGVPFGRRRIRIGRTFVTGSAAEVFRYRFLYRPLSWVSVAAAAYLAVA